MKKISVCSAVLAAMLLLTACKTQAVSGDAAVQATTAAAAQTAVTSAPITEVVALADPVDESKAANGDFSVTASGADAVVEVEGSVYTIKSAGSFTVIGALAEGQIVVDAGDEDEVKLLLDNASITCSTDAPILILNASEVTIKSEDDTYNTVTDARTGDASALEETDENYDAAIWAACDLKLTGKGTLIVSTDYDNGVKSKDDLSVKNVTLKVTAKGNALKGNDSIEIKSGSLYLVSTASDGIKTVNSDVSSKGNQRGTITFSGGQTDIYAACDGVSAAYNVEISDEETTIVNIYTASYASDAAAASVSECYLIVPVSLYADDYDYYVYFYNDDASDGVWVKCEYETMVYSGRSASYYGLAYRMPSGYQNLLFHMVDAGQTPTGENYAASTTGETVNTAMNAYLITGISGTTLSGDWVQLSSGSGNGNKTTYSSKGIKAANAIIVDGGTISVYAKDDGLHANMGDMLDNGAYGAGDVTINGGTLSIVSADDGIHADNALSINGGTVSVAEAHEGLEGNVINLAGGVVSVYGDDDGLNACAGNATPMINITGGCVEVTTPSGDTDAIDSNGSITMSGGTVLVKGGSQQGGMAGSVDVDGSITVTGGTIVALGGICSIPSGNSVNTYVSNGTSFSAGSYVLADASGNEIFSFALDGSYSSVWIASDAFALNGSYMLTKDGSTVLSWTQSSSTEGASGYSYGGFGGFGGGFGGHGGPGGRR